MTPEEHRRLDDATVFECERTSYITIRDVIKNCAHCGQPFWSRNNRRFCRATCRAANWYDVKVVRPRKKNVKRSIKRYMEREPSVVAAA